MGSQETRMMTVYKPCLPLGNRISMGGTYNKCWKQHAGVKMWAQQPVLEAMCEDENCKVLGASIN